MIQKSGGITGKVIDTVIESSIEEHSAQYAVISHKIQKYQVNYLEIENMINLALYPNVFLNAATQLDSLFFIVAKTNIIPSMAVCKVNITNKIQIVTYITINNAHFRHVAIYY